MVLSAALAFSVACSAGAGDTAGFVQLPSGFSIHLYAEVPGARSLALGEAGTVFVGTRDDAVYAVSDTDGDHRADRVRTIASGLRMPNGVAFRDGALYVAEVSRVLRYDGIEDRLDDPPEPVVLRDDLPTDRHHGWKYIAFGPEGRLYVPVGAPCNVCEESDPRYAALHSMQADGSDLSRFASGIRNTVGFDWHPETGVLWFTNNGRDWMGDELPPDTVHAAPRPGLHFGFPYCHAGDVPDPEFGAGHDCAEFAPPALKMPAHVAPLGLLFYTGDMFGPEYRNRMFIAEHGSWNRSEKVGYRVTTARPGDGTATDYRPFATGWLDGDDVRGRPVAFLQLPDGSVLVSDDHAGRIYRIHKPDAP